MDARVTVVGLLLATGCSERAAPLSTPGPTGAPAEASVVAAPVAPADAAPAIPDADAGAATASPIHPDPAAMIRLGYSLGDERGWSLEDEDTPLDARCGDDHLVQATRHASLRVERAGSGAAAAWIAAVPKPADLASLRALWCFDLTGDGVPELAYEEYSGGAHCCRTERIVSLGPTVTRLLDWPAGDGWLIEPRELDDRPGWQLVGRDQVLEEWDSAATALLLPAVFALTSTPRGPRYRRATSRFPDLVREHRAATLSRPGIGAWSRALYRAGSSVLLTDPHDWTAQREKAQAELEASAPELQSERMKVLDAAHAKLRTLLHE